MLAPGNAGVKDGYIKCDFIDRRLFSSRAVVEKRLSFVKFVIFD